jgi:hypothetical protein
VGIFKTAHASRFGLDSDKWCLMAKKGGREGRGSAQGRVVPAVNYFHFEDLQARLATKELPPLLAFV